MPRFTIRILVALLTFGIGLVASALWVALRPVEVKPSIAELHYQQAMSMVAESHGCESRKFTRLFIENNADAVSSPSGRIINAGVLDGKAIEKPTPAYPPIARSAKVSGMVVVQVTVDENGRVDSAHVVKGHPLLQNSAVAAARQARFPPTRIDGRPLKIYGVLTYKFTTQ